jgi:hypothetical protein
MTNLGSLNLDQSYQFVHLKFYIIPNHWRIMYLFDMCVIHESYMTYPNMVDYEMSLNKILQIQINVRNKTITVLSQFSAKNFL